MGYRRSKRILINKTTFLSVFDSTTHIFTPMWYPTISKNVSVAVFVANYAAGAYPMTRFFKFITAFANVQHRGSTRPQVYAKQCDKTDVCFLSFGTCKWFSIKLWWTRGIIPTFICDCRHIAALREFTHWGQDEMAAIYRQHFLVWQSSNYDSNLVEFYSQ